MSKRVYIELSVVGIATLLGISALWNVHTRWYRKATPEMLVEWKDGLQDSQLGWPIANSSSVWQRPERVNVRVVMPNKVEFQAQNAAISGARESGKVVTLYIDTGPFSSNDLKVEAAKAMDAVFQNDPGARSVADANLIHIFKLIESSTMTSTRTIGQVDGNPSITILVSPSFDQSAPCLLRYLVEWMAPSGQ